jgi:hypothetical protein
MKSSIKVQQNKTNTAFFGKINKQYDQHTSDADCYLTQKKMPIHSC